jgi:hypothetical protein
MFGISGVHKVRPKNGHGRMGGGGPRAGCLGLSDHLKPGGRKARLKPRPFKPDYEWLAASLKRCPDTNLPCTARRRHRPPGDPGARRFCGPRFNARLVRLRGRELDLGQEELSRQRQPLLVGDVGGEILEGSSTILCQGSERHRRHTALEAGCRLLSPPAG